MAAKEGLDDEVTLKAKFDNAWKLQREVESSDEPSNSLGFQVREAIHTLTDFLTRLFIHLFIHFSLHTLETLCTGGKLLFTERLL